jgi:hypothetical protein
MRAIIQLIALSAISFTVIAAPTDSKNICKDSISLVYSPAYRLCLPQTFYRNTAITPVGDLLVKFEDGSFFFGKVISADMDGLPADFDMRLYPEYLYGMRDAAKAPQSENFQNSLTVLKQRYKEFAPKKISLSNVTVYLVGGQKEAEAYVVLLDKKDTVLLLGFSEVDMQKINIILKGF